MADYIDRQATIGAIHSALYPYFCGAEDGDALSEDEKLVLSVNKAVCTAIKALPSAQPERLTDDDFETIRIHLNAYKEKLCNQHRWEEAEEYQRIIDRFMSFASAQPDVPDTNVGDMISRQAALDAVHKSILDFFDICDDDEESPMTYKDERLLELNKAITNQIKAVPSAQSDIIRCKDCRWYKTNYMWNGTEVKICAKEAYEPRRNADDFCSYGERK